MAFGAVNGAVVNAAVVNGSYAIRYGNLTVTQAANLVSSGGTVGTVGILNQTQAVNSLLFVGEVDDSGGGVIPQASEAIVASAGSTTVSGVLQITQDTNTVVSAAFEGMNWYDHTRDTSPISRHSGYNPITPHTGSSPLTVH